MLAAPQAGRGLALRVPAWSADTRISVNNDPERSVVSPGYHMLHRTWRAGDMITVHLDVTPRWTYPDGVGQTIEVTAPARGEAPVTAIAIPYFQWDNRDGGPMRVWMPRG